MNPLATMENKGSLLESQRKAVCIEGGCPVCPIKKTCFVNQIVHTCPKCDCELLDGICTNPDCGVQMTLEAR